MNFRRVPSYDVAEFAIGASNQAAVSRLEAWQSWHNGSLALIGPEAAGKTHLARLWAERVGAFVCPIGITDPLDLPDRPVVLEDVDRGVHPELLFHGLNRAIQSGVAMLLTGRSLPSTWSVEIPDLRSRLNALQVVELAPPDDTLLTNILRSFFKQRNIRPAEDLYPYLIARMERSIASAQSLVDRLDEAADAMGRPVSKALARDILGDDAENLDLFQE
ncbi:MAG: chromosomal replication initiator DnaA [Phenylobacterium zucineum]|nr:MAG: chromosomal replication initiator DnaA [Phenylobacterium zucineum]